MGSTYNILSDEPKDKVRLLISDVGGADNASFLFTDEEILAFLQLAPEEDIRLASAQALRTIAGNEAQVSKRIKFLELETNGPAVAESLIKLADKLVEEVEDDADPELAFVNTSSDQIA